MKKLTELIENDKLTDEQQDNLNDWGVQKVSDLRWCLIDKIKELQNETNNADYEETIVALYNLLDYTDNEYIIYDYRGVQELDLDTLNDALDVDL